MRIAEIVINSTITTTSTTITIINIRIIIKTLNKSMPRCRKPIIIPVLTTITLICICDGFYIGAISCIPHFCFLVLAACYEVSAIIAIIDIVDFVLA